MKPIRFEHVPEVGLNIEETFSREQLSKLLEEPDRPLAFEALDSAQIQFRIERKKNDACVTAGAELALMHPCVRCLEPVSISFQLDLKLEIENPEVLELEEILREELFLELPLYPTCEPVCS